MSPRSEPIRWFCGHMTENGDHTPKTHGDPTYDALPAHPLRCPSCLVDQELKSTDEFVLRWLWLLEAEDASSLRAEDRRFSQAQARHGAVLELLSAAREAPPAFYLEFAGTEHKPLLHIYSLKQVQMFDMLAAEIDGLRAYFDRADGFRNMLRGCVDYLCGVQRNPWPYILHAKAPRDPEAYETRAVDKLCARMAQWQAQVAQKVQDRDVILARWLHILKSLRECHEKQKQTVKETLPTFGHNRWP